MLFESQLKYPLDIQSKGIVESIIDNRTVRVRQQIIRKTFDDFDDAGATKDITLFFLLPRAEIITCWFNVIIAFAHASTYTISVGPDSLETTLQTAQDVKTAGLKKAVGTDFTTNRPFFSLTADTVIEAKATVGAGATNTATAGLVDFFFIYVIH